MIINCKIGTKSSTVLRVKGKRTLPKIGERIKGIPLIEYKKHSYHKWNGYLVIDYWEDERGRFYYLSL